MNFAVFSKKLALVLFVVAGLVLVGFAGRIIPARNTGQHPDPERVNLALRRTAHYLLAAAGDSTTRIPPVRQIDAKTWLVELQNSFDYEKLPRLLQASFDVQGIHGDYNVTVLDCADGSVQLGYNFLDFKQNKEAPCSGRASDNGCYNLQVSFVQPSAAEPLWAGRILAFGLLAGLVYSAWRFWPGRRPLAPAPAAAETDPGQLNFGYSSLHPANQVLIAAGKRHNLTYRETKLLHLFATHINQMLEREFILQNVWADEGIIVGRSIDVFVSRLRKLLRDDPALRIVTVHGVGYRLETGWEGMG